MNRLHQIAEGGVDHSMLLDEAPVTERGCRYGHVEVVSGARRIGDLDLGARDAVADPTAHLVGAHHVRSGSRRSDLGQVRRRGATAARQGVQVIGDVALLSQVQTLVAWGWVTVMVKAVAVPVQTVKVTPWEKVTPGSDAQLLE